MVWSATFATVVVAATADVLLLLRLNNVQPLSVVELQKDCGTNC
jgi:hypothetical protein